MPKAHLTDCGKGCRADLCGSAEEEGLPPWLRASPYLLLPLPPWCCSSLPMVVKSCSVRVPSSLRQSPWVWCLPLCLPRQDSDFISVLLKRVSRKLLRKRSRMRNRTFFRNCLRRRKAMLPSRPGIMPRRALLMSRTRSGKSLRPGPGGAARSSASVFPHLELPARPPNRGDTRP